MLARGASEVLLGPGGSEVQQVLLDATVPMAETVSQAPQVDKGTGAQWAPEVCQAALARALAVVASMTPSCESSTGMCKASCVALQTPVTLQAQQ